MVGSVVFPGMDTSDSNNNSMNGYHDNNNNKGEETERGGDLNLGPPQNYTAQVRDVIRARLLASRGMKPENRPTDTTPQERDDAPSEAERAPEPGLSPIGLPPAPFMGVYPGFNGLGFQGKLRPGAPYVLPDPACLRRLSAPSMLKIPSPILFDENQNDAKYSDQNSPGSCSDTAAGEQRVYRCDYCSKTFLFKSKYHEHLPVHTNARPYQCHLCSRTYKYKYDLRVHLRTHMGIPTKSTVCPFCHVKYDTNKLLRLHIQNAHGDRKMASPEECTQPVENLPPAL